MSPEFERRRALAPAVAAGLLLLAAAVILILPGALVLTQLVQGLSSGQSAGAGGGVGGGSGARVGGGGLRWSDVLPDAPLLARTVGTALLIAGLATLAAWPAAWAARLWSWRRLLILLVPMLLPSYLAYAGWGAMRAPGTWLGDFLLRGPPGAESAADNWWPLAAARVQAIMGLTLWVWPLAAAILVAHFRRLDQHTLEALRLEPIGPLRRMLSLLTMTRGGTLAAAGVVALVMLGSAIPLHVAQFETYAIVIWRRMTEVPHSEQWRVWVAAWPLLGIAAFSAVLITRRLSEIDQGGAPERREQAGCRCSGLANRIFFSALWLWPAVLLGVSVAVPAILFASTLRSLQPLWRFWNLSWQPLLGSSAVSGIVAVLATGMIVCAWMAGGGPSFTRRVASGVAVLFLMAGLIPGVLIGAAAAQAWTMLGGWIPIAREMADSPAILVIVHLGRFGFIPVLAGIILARTEPRNLRDLRALDTGGSFIGFLRAALPPQLAAVLAGGLGTGVLSFHEIEAAVLVQPPSAVGGGLPWQMLQWLHFARMEDLSAAVLWVLALAGAALVLLAMAAHLCAVYFSPGGRGPRP